MRTTNQRLCATPCASPRLHGETHDRCSSQKSKALTVMSSLREHSHLTVLTAALLNSA